MSKLTISPKPLDKDNSKFYSKFFIKIPTTFVLNEFSDEQIKIVEKFTLDRLLKAASFTEERSKFKNIKLGGFKNSQIFTVVW